MHFPVWDNGIVRLAGRTTLVVGIFSIFFLKSSSNRQILSDAILSARNWFNLHLILPAKAILNELFFNKLSRSSSREAAADAQQSLLEMLEDYRKDKGLLNQNAEISISEISKAYERAIIHPIREGFFGDLVRLALIQVQLLKSEILQLANEVDDIVVKNRFNTQLLTALPALYLVYSSFKSIASFWYWLRDESISIDNAQEELRLVAWTAENLLIQEDDGPPVYSFLTADERASEGGGSEHWDQAANRLLRTNSGNDDDEENVGDFIFPQLMEEVDPSISYRRKLAGKFIATLHHLNNLLIRSRNVLFRKHKKKWEFTLREIENVFPRSGWSSHARLQLIKSITFQMNYLS